MSQGVGRMFCLPKTAWPPTSKSGGGRQHPRSPWGQISKGLKTRKKKNNSDKYIVKRRSK